MNKCVDLDSIDNEFKTKATSVNENLNNSSILKNTHEKKVEKKFQNTENNFVDFNDIHTNKLKDEYLYLYNSIIENNTKKNCVIKRIDENFKNYNYNYNVFSDHINNNKVINSENKLEDMNIIKLYEKERILINEHNSAIINNDSKKNINPIINMNYQNNNLNENTNELLECKNYGYDSIDKKNDYRNMLETNNNILISNTDKRNYNKGYFFHEKNNLMGRNYDNIEKRNDINLKENKFYLIDLNNNGNIRNKLYLDSDENKGNEYLTKSYGINNEKENISRNNIYNIFNNSNANKNNNVNAGILNFLKNKKKYKYRYDNKGIRNEIKENENNLYYKNSVNICSNTDSSLLKGSIEDNEYIKDKILTTNNLCEYNSIIESDLKKKELLKKVNVSSFETLQLLENENSNIKNIYRNTLKDNLKKKENESDLYTKANSTKINQNNPFNVHHYVKKENIDTSTTSTKNMPMDPLNNNMPEYSKTSINNYYDMNKLMSIINEKSKFNKKGLDIFTTLSEIHSIHSSNYNHYSKKSLKSEMSKHKKLSVKNINNKENSKEEKVTIEESHINKQNKDKINSLQKEEKKKKEQVKREEESSYQCNSSYSLPSSTNSTICSSLSKKRTAENKVQKEIKDNKKIKNIKYKKNNAKAEDDMKIKQGKDNLNVNKSSKNYKDTSNYDNCNSSISNDDDNKSTLTTTINYNSFDKKNKYTHLTGYINRMYYKNKMKNKNDNNNNDNNSESNFFTNSNFSDDGNFSNNNNLKNGYCSNIKSDSSKNYNNKDENCCYENGKNCIFNKNYNSMDNSSNKDSNDKNKREILLEKSKSKQETNKNIVKRKVKNEVVFSDKKTILKNKNNTNIKTKFSDSCKNSKKAGYTTIVDDSTLKKEHKINKKDYNYDCQKKNKVERNGNENEYDKNDYNKNTTACVNHENCNNDKTVVDGNIISRNSSVSTSNNSSKYINNNINNDSNLNESNNNLNNQISSNVKEKLKNKVSYVCDPIKNECKILSSNEYVLKNRTLINKRNIYNDANNGNGLNNYYNDNENETIHNIYHNHKKSIKSLNNDVKKRNTKSENRNNINIENEEKVISNNKKKINTNKNNNNNKVTKNKNDYINNSSNNKNIKTNNQYRSQNIKEKNDPIENKEEYKNFVCDENSSITKNKKIHMISEKKSKGKKILKDNVDLYTLDNSTNDDPSLSKSNHSVEICILKKKNEPSSKIKKEVYVLKSKYNNLQNLSKKEGDKAIDTHIKYNSSTDNIKSNHSNNLKDKTSIKQKIECKNNHKMIINEVGANNYKKTIKKEVDKKNFLYMDDKKQKKKFNEEEKKDTLINIKKNETVMKQQKNIIRNSTNELNKNGKNISINNSYSINNLKLDGRLNTCENCKNSKNLESCKLCNNIEKDNDNFIDNEITYKNTCEEESNIFNENLIYKENNMSDTIISWKLLSTNENLKTNSKNEESIYMNVKPCIDKGFKKNQNKFSEIENLKMINENYSNKNIKKDISNIRKNNTLSNKEKEIPKNEKNEILLKVETLSNKELSNRESIQNSKNEVDRKSYVYKNNFFEQEQQKKGAMDYEKKENNKKIEIDGFQQTNLSNNINKNPFYLFTSQKNKSANSFVKSDNTISNIENKVELKEHSNLNNTFHNNSKINNDKDRNNNDSETKKTPNVFNTYTQNITFSNNDNFEKKINDCNEFTENTKKDVKLNCVFNNSKKKEECIEKGNLFNSTIMNNMEIKNNLGKNKNILSMNLLNENAQNIDSLPCNDRNYCNNKKDINIYLNNLNHNEDKKKTYTNNLIFFHEFEHSMFFNETILDNSENLNSMNNIIKKEQKINFNNFSLNFANIIKNYKEKSENYLNKKYTDDLDKIYFLVQQFIETYSCNENLKSIFQLLKSEIEKIKKEILYFSKDQKFLIFPLFINDIKQNYNNLDKEKKEHICENKLDNFTSKRENKILEYCENESNQGYKCLRKSREKNDLKFCTSENNNNIKNNCKNNYYTKKNVNKKFERISYLTSTLYHANLNKRNLNKNIMNNYIKTIEKNKSSKKRISNMKNKFLSKRNIFIIRNNNYVHKFKLNNYFFLKNKQLKNKKINKFFQIYLSYNKEMFKKDNYKREIMVNKEIITDVDTANYNIEDLFISDDEVNLIYTYYNHHNEKVYSLEKIDKIKNENSSSATLNENIPFDESYYKKGEINKI